MAKDDNISRFDATLLCPEAFGGNSSWAFVVLPSAASAKLPRRGRTSINGTINGENFTLLLEPDGQKSHWLKLDKELMDAAGPDFGDVAHFEIQAVDEEPEPEVPDDLNRTFRLVSYGSH